MEDHPVPTGRPLIKASTYKDNFRNKCENQTHLCYELDVWEGRAWVPVKELKGFLCNQGADTHREHCPQGLCFLDFNNRRKPQPRAELCFLALFQPGHLNAGEQYRLTWYISWSPCPDCVPQLVDFLRENRHVTLRIFAAHLDTKLSGYEDGLRDLQCAGAKLFIMTFKELCFLDRVRSWHLDERRRYRLTCYMSWSPCPDCAQKLVDFLGENSRVSLCLFPAGIQTRFPGHEDGLRKLRDAGAQLTIMTRDEHQRCWDTFVDKDNPRLWPRTKVEVHIGDQCQILESILWNQGN